MENVHELFREAMDDHQVPKGPLRDFLAQLLDKYRTKKLKIKQIEKTADYEIEQIIDGNDIDFRMKTSLGEMRSRSPEALKNIFRRAYDKIQTNNGASTPDD